jgi:hypothetical protein
VEGLKKYKCRRQSCSAVTAQSRDAEAGSYAADYLFKPRGGQCALVKLGNKSSKLSNNFQITKVVGRRGSGIGVPKVLTL